MPLDRPALPAPGERPAQPSSRADRARPAADLVTARVEPPLTREQILITAGVMAGMAVAALDTTVVGTAMPTIIGQLGGLAEYGWVFSGYLLTATTSVPLFSRLADVYGRKPIFFIGLFLFVAGSMLSGLSGSMLELILFRTIQGLGAGALQPVAFTIVGDIFDTARRARMQGLFSGVWGVAAIFGPALGGVITSTVGWRWVFYINVPVGILAGVLIGVALHERVQHRQHRIDWWGAVALTLGVVLLLFALTEGGDLFGWVSLPMALLLAASIVSLVGFVVIERRAAEPLIDFELVRRPIIAVGLGIGTLAGVVMFGLTTYVPPMVQGVHGGSPVDAGAAVAAMSIGWPIGSIVGGRAMLRFGIRPTVLAGGVMLVIGSAVIAQLAVLTALWEAMLGAAITGLGMGLATTTILVVIQGVVPWRQRGVATGLVTFSRTIGGAIGVGLMGAALTAGVGNNASAILDPIRSTQIPHAQLLAMRDALSNSLSLIYASLLACAVAALVIAIRSMPAEAIHSSAAIDAAERAAAEAADRATADAGEQAGRRGAVDERSAVTTSPAADA